MFVKLLQSSRQLLYESMFHIPETQLTGFTYQCLLTSLRCYMYYYEKTQIVTSIWYTNMYEIQVVFCFVKRSTVIQGRTVYYGAGIAKFALQVPNEGFTWQNKFHY